MLLFDAGNSRCKWVRIKNGLWLKQGVLDNDDKSAWQNLKNDFSVLASPEKIMLSNVAGSAIEKQIRELCAAWPSSPLKVMASQPEQCGVINGYEQAAQLGSDRWAALIAAWHRVRGACLVVTCGTATTVDALSDTGEFIGGIILPGLELMQQSLLSNTAQLELGAGEPRDFPRNTADAITSGVLQANIGAIRHQHALLAARYEISCVLSGGAAQKILPYLGLQVIQIDDLVLHGLQIIGQECSTKEEN